MALDSDISAVLEQMKSGGLVSFDAVPLDQLRAFMRAKAAAAPEGPAMSRVEDFDVRVGEVSNAVRLYVPEGEVRAIISFCHGGGWTLGSLDESDYLVRVLAKRLRCAIVSIDYRHAPESVFPAAVDDVRAAIEWLAGQKATLVGADLPLIVAGDSAGANLSTVICQMFRGNPDVAIAGQILLNPNTHGVSRIDYLDAFESPFCTKQDILYFLDLYMPDGTSREDVRFAPALADSLANLPPAFILTADEDVLHTEAEEYGLALATAGVRTTVKRYPGTIHSFLAVNPDFAKSHEAISDISAFVASIVDR